MTTFDFVPSVAELSQKLTIAERRNVTPDLAKQVLEAWPYKGQRNIRSSRIMTYQRQMETTGEWVYRTDTHLAMLPDGDVYLLNGYHRLQALSQVSLENVTIPILFTFEYLKDAEDMANYYGVMDIGGMRSPTDAIHAQGLAETWGVSPEVLRSIGSAGALIMTDFTGGRSNSWHSAVGRSIPARINFIRAWEEEAYRVQDLYKKSSAPTRKPMLRQPIVGVMLLTLRDQPQKAEAFWTKVVTGEGLYKGDPENTLRNYILNTKMSGTPEHVYARYVANCWNAFYQGRKLGKAQVHSEGLTDLIVIEGTTYSRNRRDRERQKRLEAMRARAGTARQARQDQRNAQAPEVEVLEELPTYTY